jgi:hypothetical protein
MVFAMPHLFPGLSGIGNSRRHSDGHLDNSLRASSIRIGDCGRAVTSHSSQGATAYGLLVHVDAEQAQE